MNKKNTAEIVFEREREERISKYLTDIDWVADTKKWLKKAFLKKYMYNFEWLGRPIIQTPIDMVAAQELIWEVRPDLIIETGIAHGGSLIMSASMLALLDMSDAIELGEPLNPSESSRRVLGVDIDIRQHNKRAIESHPMSSRIEMIEGSSTAPAIIEQVQQFAKSFERVLVFLATNHTHDHVLAELQAYAPLTSIGSYCVVFDTIVEDLPADVFPDRPWGPGNSPKTAVWEYLKTNPEFTINKAIQNKLLMTLAPDGYLERIR